MTNADKVREMSIEELAQIIMCPYDIDEDMCNKKTDCLTCCENWLNKERDENETD